MAGEVLAARREGPPAANPHSEYRRRLESRQRSLENERQRSRRIWFWRRLVFALILLMFMLAYEQFVPWWLAAAPVIAFIALMAIHQRIQASVARYERSVKFYERGIARLEDRWSGAGEPGERFADKSHPYSEDLDLFGKGSLFELLSTARTKAGEERLAGWLLAPASRAEILARQQAIEELRPRLDLREDIA